MEDLAAITPRWLSLPGAARYSGLSTRLLEDYIRDGLVRSSMVKKPGAGRGRRLLDRESLDALIELGVSGKSDVDFTRKDRPRKGGRR